MTAVHPMMAEKKLRTLPCDTQPCIPPATNLYLPGCLPVAAQLQTRSRPDTNLQPPGYGKPAARLQTCSRPGMGNYLYKYRKRSVRVQKRQQPPPDITQRNAPEVSHPIKAATGSFAATGGTKEKSN